MGFFSVFGAAIWLAVMVYVSFFLSDEGCEIRPNPTHQQEQYEFDE